MTLFEGHYHPSPTARDAYRALGLSGFVESSYSSSYLEAPAMLPDGVRPRACSSSNSSSRVVLEGGVGACQGNSGGVGSCSRLP